jgi:anti-anti-sigma regulatory factor
MGRRLREQLWPLLLPDTTVVLDLAHLTFLGPVTTRMLMAANSHADEVGARLVLWRARAQPLRLLHQTRLHQTLTLRPARWRPTPLARTRPPARRRQPPGVSAA